MRWEILTCLSRRYLRVCPWMVLQGASQTANFPLALPCKCPLQTLHDETFLLSVTARYAAERSDLTHPSLHAPVHST